MPKRPPVHCMPFMRQTVRLAHVVPNEAPKPTLRIYGTERWKRLRREVLRLAGYQCQRCGVSVRGLGESRVDHIVPVKEQPDMAFRLDNLRVLCVGCDAVRHREKGHARRPSTSLRAGAG